MNSTIAEKINNIHPFDHVRRTLALASEYADLIVVSQTPYESLTREWKEHNLNSYVRVIAGQEMGKK